MPPVRRRESRDQAAAAAVPRTCRTTSGCRQRGRRRADEEIDGAAALPDDALAGVLSRFVDLGDVVRCAATCRRWGRVVTARASSLARALPPPGRLLPRLAIGVFHQEAEDAPAARTRGSSSPPAMLPCFVPMASAARLITDDVWCPLIRSHGDGLLRNSRPVASRNGRLVLELQQEGGHSDGRLKLCVCNPMSGDAAVLPALSSGPQKPRDYGCALLTGDDDDLSPLTSFHVLLLYNNRRGSTALRCYYYSSSSSSSGGWGPEAKCSTRISGGKLHRIGQAVVLRGVAFWPLDDGALGVRVSAATGAEITEMHLLPYDVPHYWPEARLLGVLPDDRLFFVYFGICGDTLMAKLSYFAIDGDDVGAGRKECSSLEEGIRMHQMKVTCQDTLKLRWVCEKSGLIFFTLRESSSGRSGTFALNLHDKLVEKVADGEGHKWRNFVGYEMGTAGYLASIAPRAC
ncbi:unnamed protein product [Urochloa decumbens]|uniref:F-box domain-containing protein n=1 Tax=Urochloa decumbens TaxID=240449 RepID=A0ABC8YU11_9POAL